MKRLLQIWRTSRSEALRLAVNSLFAFIALIVTRFANSIFFILLSWIIGEREAGTFALSMGYSLLFIQLSLWGLDNVITRDIAANRTLAGSLLGSFLALRLLVGLAFYGLVALWIQWLAPHDAHTNEVILVLGATIITESVGRVCQSYFTAFERLSYLAALNTTLGLLKLLIGVVVLWLGGDARAAAWVVLLASALTMVAGVVLAYTRFPPPRWRDLLPLWAQYVPVALPFMATSMLNTVEMQADMLLIAYLAPGDAELAVGTYNAATMLLFGLWMLPFSYRTAILPLMARLHSRQSQEIWPIYEKSTLYLLAATAPVAMIVDAYAPQMLRLIYGGRWGDAGMVLSVVIWALVFLSANIAVSCVLIVERRHVTMTLIQSAAAIVNIGVNLLLVPRLGPDGAAWARVGSAVVSFGLGFGFVQIRLHAWSFVRDLLRLMFALAMLLAALLLLRNLPLPWTVSATLAAIVYAVAVLASGLVRAEDRQMLGMLMGYSGWRTSSISD